jgi:Domain of Unknown Function (DUF349)
MSQELNEEQKYDFNGWWNEQSFTGKELFKLEESGELNLLSNPYVKERTITSFSPESHDAVLKNLIEKFASLEAKLRELEVEWIATEDKLKMAEKVAHIKEQINQCNGVGDFARAGALIHDWEHTIYTLAEENYAAKVSLTEQAEGLAASEEWKDATQAFRDIADKWKQMGHVDKGRNDKLWNRIEAARKAFQDRKKVHHEDEEKNMLVNLDLKIDLVEQAEAIASSEEWKKTSDTFQRLTEEWKTIGHTINKKNEELWQRFIAAKTAFFDRKRDHSKKIAIEHETNYAAKLAIVERAEAVKDSTDWNATSQAYATMMEEWKKTGRVQAEKADELWKRFVDAQDVFFSAKKLHFGAIRSVQEENYARKKELYDRAEEIKNSTHWKDTTDEMIQLLEDWKKIGPIPRSYGDKMWEDFNAARKYFFERKDASREQRKQYVETQRAKEEHYVTTQKAQREQDAEAKKAQRAAEAKASVKKLVDDIKEEEEKLVDFKNAIENITPGKKAAELKAHLETLIVEVAANLQRLKDKYEQGQKDMKAAESKHAEAVRGEKAEEPVAASEATAEVDARASEPVSIDGAGNEAAGSEGPDSAQQN